MPDTPTEFHKALVELNLSYAQIELIKQAVDKYVIPTITSTNEELDKANTHLDSTSQAYWSAYNKGFISNSTQARQSIWGTE